MKILLDTNVVLDVLAARQPWLRDAGLLLTEVENGNAEAFVAAHTISNIHYLLSKLIGKQAAAAALVDLVRLVRVAAIDHDVVLQALALGWNDVEDALQAVCALQSEVDLFVTRDPRGFASIPIQVVTPGEAYAHIVGMGDSPSDE